MQLNLELDRISQLLALGQRMCFPLYGPALINFGVRFTGYHQHRGLRRVIGGALLVALLLAAVGLGITGAAQAAPEQVSVLILLPGQPGLPAATAIASGIRDVLLTEWSFRASIEMEHVDVARFASA